MPQPEPSNFLYIMNTIFGIIALISLYTFGVWLRSYVFRTEKDWPIRRQLLASVPVGLITMALYGKTALPGLDFNSPNVAFDICLIAGYTIIFGMLSREALERFLSGGADLPKLPKA